MTLDTLAAVGPLPEDLTVHLDRGYASGKTCDELAQRGLKGQIAQKGKPAPIQASRRWPVERTHAWATTSGNCAGAPSATPVVEFWLALAHVIITLGRLLRQAWSTTSGDPPPAPPMTAYWRRHLGCRPQPQPGGGAYNSMSTSDSTWS